MKALKPFLLVVAVLVAALSVDIYVRRPHQIPKPASADSLAGVISRLFPGRADSAAIRRVTWYESPDRWLGLNWISTDDYRYRNTPQAATAPMVGEADLKRFRITLAKGQRAPWLIAHELGHLLLNEPNHPAAIFQRIETYNGR